MGSHGENLIIYLKQFLWLFVLFCLFVCLFGFIVCLFCFIVCLFCVIVCLFVLLYCLFVCLFCFIVCLLVLLYWLFVCFGGVLFLVFFVGWCFCLSTFFVVFLRFYFIFQCKSYQKGQILISGTIPGESPFLLLYFFYEGLTLLLIISITK